MLDDENPRKARRDKRRVPKIKEIPPFKDLPSTPIHYTQINGRDKQIGREVCIQEQAHDLVRNERGWTYHYKPGTGYVVFCRRCGEFGGITQEE